MLLRLTEQPAARLTDSLKSLLHYGHPSVGDGTLSYLLGRLSAPECSPTLQAPMLAAWGLADGRYSLDIVPGYGRSHLCIWPAGPPWIRPRRTRTADGATPRCFILYIVMYCILVLC